MSLVSWKKEFYTDIPDNGSGMTKTQTIKHSLKKWTGLTKKNLSKHELKIVSRMLYDDKKNTFFEINDSNCALCEKYITYAVPKAGEPNTTCRKCPLYKSLGTECSGDITTPYVKWVNTGNANPMIKALQKLLETLNKK